MIRTEFGCSVSRFAELVGVPRRTCHGRLACLRAGDPPKGPWPAPVVDRIEPDAAEYAEEWSAWGYRKIEVSPVVRPVGCSYVCQVGVGVGAGSLAGWRVGAGARGNLSR